MKRTSRRAFAPALVAVTLALATAGSTSAESASLSASLRVLPIEITLELSAMDVRAGDPVKARATIRNAGPTRIANVAVDLRLGASSVSVRGSLVATVARLQPGHDATVSWTLCPTATGNFLVLARATLDGASVESDARLLTVAGQRRRAC